ncbi:hypothetical protein HU200_017614 [Digitaria exilis]|uniref:Uncharacterized protein n=1 Tax=Digitaria exilis TaxID=1010633 RepID=A0A835F6D6_9POAL|nr:hypothetical protein HU200_017614 [Digitaria exilis]
MATILENIQKTRFLPTRPLKDELPTFQGGGLGGGGGMESHLMGLRKRLSSFSGKIQPISSASAEWAFRRSKSAPSLGAAFAASGGSLRQWWQWGVGWLLSKKPGFAGDLEMNEEEVVALGRQSRGSWGHILYKMRSGVRRLVMSTHSLPTTQKQSLPSAAVHHSAAQCKPAAAFAYAQRQSFHHNGHALAH